MVVEVVVVLVEAEHACEVAQLSVCDLRATMSSPLSALDLRCLARCCCGLNQKKRRQVYQTLVCILNSLLLICFILGFLYGFYYKKRETRHGSPVMKAMHILVKYCIAHRDPEDVADETLWYFLFRKAVSLYNSLEV